MSNSQTFMPSTETLFQKTAENTMVVNMGPQHPSTHGVLRVICELEGETIVKCKCVIGYLHTGMEKEAEYQQYQKCVVMTDRMDYLNSNGGFVDLAGQKALAQRAERHKADAQFFQRGKTPSPARATTANIRFAAP